MNGIEGEDNGYDSDDSDKLMIDLNSREPEEARREPTSQEDIESILEQGMILDEESEDELSEAQL